MKTISRQQLERLRHADESVKGTVDYTRYQMPLEWRNSSGRWIFLGYGIPNVNLDTSIQNVRGNIYIVQTNADGLHRWRISDAVQNLLDS